MEERAQLPHCKHKHVSDLRWERGARASHWFCCRPRGLVPDSPKGASMLRRKTPPSLAADTAPQGLSVSGDSTAELVKTRRVAPPEQDAKHDKTLLFTP